MSYFFTLAKRIGAVSAGLFMSVLAYRTMAKPNESPRQKNDSGDDSDSDTGSMESLLQMFAKKLGLSRSKDDAKVEHVLEEPTFNGIVKYIKSGNCKNIIVLAGAGISTAAGIPDFRSPGSGLYDNLKKYNLPYPQAIFEISYFKENPEPFYALAKELYPGSFKPTKSHYFIRLLHEKNLLLRMYTQNIDTLERIAGIPEEKLVEAHGTFFTSHCTNRSCKKEYDLPWMKEKIFADEIPKCLACKAAIKPDIVFFGEALPDKFYSLLPQDFQKCDLLIILGTSLAVQPFASLIDRVPSRTPRFLINKEKAGERDYTIWFLAKFLGFQTDDMLMLLGFGGGMKFDSEDNYRDVAWLGFCDEGCQALADALGWKEDLEHLVTENVSEAGASK